ncbi:MAG: hypothetical protein P0Y59_24375 [Candidatus Sphingomonas phytovorans]|nr:hypothetical protein [Sphingomonas sp.]WEJ99994.1 MAG: hypothetical protein P0Y59_24375 [Sphingomonas sp.]
MRHDRLNDPQNIDSNAIRSLVAAGYTPVVQFSQPGYTPKLLGTLNQLCAELGEKLQVRFYGHYSTGFDASALEHLPDVRSLLVDCLTTITNEHLIATLPALSALSFGVFRYDNPGFLDQIGTDRLTSLTLVETAKRNFDLAPLGAARNMKRLLIHGHTRNIEVIADLPQLADLMLGAFPNKKDLGFLKDAKALKSLRVILGGRSSIDEFSHPGLEDLSIVRVRGLQTVGDLRRFPHLRSLEIEDQLQLLSIDLVGPPLRRVLLANCKNLAEVRGIETLEHLESFRTMQTKLDMEALATGYWPASVRAIALYPGSTKRNQAVRATLDARGYGEWDPESSA